MLSEIDARALHEIIEREALEACGYERCVVWVLRDGIDGKKVLAPGTRGDEVVAGGAEARLLREIEVIDADSPEIARRLLDAGFGPGPDSPLLLPLHSGADLIGVLLLDGPVRKTIERCALLDFAAQAAGALANHRSLERSHRHEAQLSTLSDAFTELSSSFDLEALLSSTIASARDVVDAPIGYVMLLDAAVQEIYMRSASGVTGKRFGRLRLRPGAGLGGNVLERRRVFFTSDYLVDERFDHLVDVDESVREEGIKSLTGIPMFTRGQFLGVLFVAHRTPQSTSPEEIAILTRLAQYAALAIETARLRERDRDALQKIQNAMSVISAQNHQLRRAEEAQARLTEALLAGKGVDGIMATFADLVPGSAVLLRGDQIVAEVGEPTWPIALGLGRHGLGGTARRKPEVARAFKALRAAEPWTIHAADKDGEQSSYVVPVVASEEVLGSLWVAVEDGNVDEYRSVIEETGRAVALELMRERSIGEVELRLQREFLDDLLADHPSEAVIERRAESLRIDLDGPLRLCVVGVRSPEDVRADALREQVYRSLRAKAWCRFAAEHMGFVVAIVAGEQGSASAIEGVLAETGARTLAAVLSEEGLAVTEFGDAYRIARRLIGVDAGGLARRVVDLSEARTLTLLAREDDRGSLRRFANATLGPLLELDPEKRGDLLLTLETFLTVGMSPSRAAAELHIHVNTLYYRLERLRELLGDSFSTPSRALDLQVACLAWRILLSEA
ncbi:MAG: helix-turn-helix domain-containing protein [Solirubrobacterales bacterium]